MVSKEFMSVSEILWFKFSENTKEILGELQHEILNSEGKICFMLEIECEIEILIVQRYLNLKGFRTNIKKDKIMVYLI